MLAPDVPVTISEELPALMPVAFRVIFELAGNALIVFGEMLQLPPCDVAHVNATEPVKPSCDVTLIVPFALPPDFTVGNVKPVVSTKSGLSVTFKVNDWVLGAGAPLLVA